MKSLKKFLVLLTFLSGLNAQAWISTESPEKIYNFKFKLQGQIYEYTQKSSTYEDAFEQAAKSCYQHYKAGRPLTEERGLDIIDVCANPRT
jgi:hypothetical protein